MTKAKIDNALDIEMQTASLEKEKKLVERMQEGNCLK